MKDTKKVVHNVTFTRERALLSGGSGLLIALSLSACGGGGSSNGGSQNTTTPIISPSTQIPVSGQSGSELTISKAPSASAYSFVSNVTGLSLVDPDLAIVAVANDTGDNAYAVELKATGAGTLEFRFDDANDTITLTSESVLSGFTEFRVTNGTVDAREADLGDVDYIEIASSVSLKVSQLASIDNIVSKSSSGIINIEVKTLDDIATLEALMASKDIEVFSQPATFKMVKAAGSTLPDEVLVTGEETVKVQTQPVASAPPVILNVPQTVVAKKPTGSLQIANNDKYINILEAQSATTVKVVVESGTTVRSVKMGGNALSVGSRDGEYIISAEDFSDGEYTLVAELVSQQGVITQLNDTITVDRVSPTVSSVTIEGEDNGLNSTEISAPLKVFADVSSDASVTEMSVVGMALGTDASGTYILDASKLAEGTHTLSVVAKDLAGNSQTYQKDFVVDFDGAEDATVSFSGAPDDVFNLSEADSTVSASVAVPSGGTLTGVALSGSSVDLNGGNSFDFKPSTLGSGVHDIVVSYDDASGSSNTSIKTFMVDLTPPADAILSTVGDDFTLNSTEVASSTPLFVEPGSGNFVKQVTLNGSSVAETVTENTYSYNSSSLRAGVHEISTVTSDSAGNETVTNQKLVVLNNSNSGTFFEIETSALSDGRTQFDFHVINVPSAFANEIPSFQFKLSYDTTDFSFDPGQLASDSGAFTIRPGNMGRDVSQAGVGKLGISGVFDPDISDFETPIVTLRGVAEPGNVSFLIYDAQFSDFEISDGTYGAFIA